MTDRTDNEAMSLIRRAAILLEERGEGCLTPGANYETSIQDRTLSIKVNLTDEQVAMLEEQTTKYPHRIPYMDTALHDYFQVAVWKILNGKVV